MGAGYNICLALRCAGSLRRYGDSRKSLHQFPGVGVTQLRSALRDVEHVDCFLRFRVHEHDFDIAATL